MKTRKQYLDGECTHEEYYGQFVTREIRQLVSRTFTVPRLVASPDPHFNDITLRRWDALAGSLGKPTEAALRDRGDWLSLAGAVCILKEAARQVVEAHVQKREVLA